MCALIGAKPLGGDESFVEIVPDKPDLDVVPAKHSGFQDFLFRGGDGHENHAANAKIFAHEGNALCMVPRRGTDKKRLIGDHLAHCIECPAQFVGSYWRQILSLEPDVGPVAVRQQFVSQ